MMKGCRGWVLGAGLAVVSSLGGAAIAADPQPLPLLPQPAQLTRDEGQLEIDAGTRIVVRRGDAAAARVAGQLADEVRRLRGLNLAVGEGRGRSASATRIELMLDDKAAATDEGYTLSIDTRVARVAARGEAGLFYGMQTLAQLLSADGGQGATTVPALRIVDAPRFAWRGLMLDVARHYMPVPEIERLLDAMALHKLNVFHWHLTDDQGWRLQIRRYPQLTGIGAWRLSPLPGPDGQPQRYGGF
jgi:hexosaminidase